MPTSVGTKAEKKQSTLSGARLVPASDKEFENSLLSLENACFTVLENQFSSGKGDTDGRYWQERFINIANPVSLALMEYKGPRHFHQHYRHRKDDESVLQPVLENPIVMLAQVCKVAIKACQSQLVGLQDPSMIDMRRMFENALRDVLLRYKDYCKQIKQ